jgi:hypothetical protein
MLDNSAGAEGSTTVTLTPADTAVCEGVLRATLYDVATLLPLAERLIFREPADRCAYVI